MPNDGGQLIAPQRQSAIWLSAAAVVAVFYIGYLWYSDFGILALNNGVDWAHHMAIIDVIATGESWSAPEVIRRLGIFAVYPHASHYLAAWLAQLTGASPLQSIHWVGNAAIIVSAAITAVRLSSILSQSRHLVTGFLAAATGILVLYYFAYWGTGFSGQLQWMFFYPQAVGTAVALICLVGFQQLTRDDIPLAAMLAATPVSAWVVASMHPTPAVFVVACAASCVLSRRGAFMLRAVEAAGTGLLGVAALLLLPGFRGLMRLMDGTAGGDIHIESQRLNLSVEPMVLLAALIILALLVVVAMFILGRCDVFRTHAGAVAVLACASLAGILLVRGRAIEYYSVAKYAYLYCAELALLIASLVRALADKFIARSSISYARITVLSIVAIPVAVVAQKTYVTKYLQDQRPLIRAFTQAKAGEIRTVPRTLGATERYYLAVSALHENIDDALPILLGKRVD